MLEHAPKLPRVVREEDFHKASRMILDPNTIAVVTPYDEAFGRACRSYQYFALERTLGPESDCFYKTMTADRSNFICFGKASEIIGGKGSATQSDSDVRNLLHSFFEDIGFTHYDPASSQLIVRKILDGRQLLADLFPNTRSNILTQINVGGSVPLPHIHNDIALGKTICGATTILVNPEQAQDYKFRIRKEEPSLLLGSLESVPTTQEHNEGYMSVRRDHFLFFKGARGPHLPFGHPDNIGAVHLSPDDQTYIDGSPIPRMFIASFIHPPGWDNMELYMPPR